MYSVSKEMSLQSYQIVNPSENQTDFKAGQIVRFTIPRQVGFFDAHLSKLQFLCRTSGANYKMSFLSPKGGVASMIDMVRLSQNGRVISEITEYSTLQHFIKTYENSLSTAQVDALYKGCVDYTSAVATEDRAGSYNALFGQGLNRSGATGATDMEQDVKFQLNLDFISLFEVLHAVPMMAMGDILLEIRLVQRDVEIMKIMPQTAEQQPISPALANPVPAASTTFTMKPSFSGWTNLADSPFIKGMKLSFLDAVGTESATQDYVIDAMSQAQDGTITFTLDKAIVDEAGARDATHVLIKSGADGTADAGSPEIIVSQSQLQLQVVKPPDQYVSDLASQVEGQGLMIDMDDFTTYRSTVLSAIKNQTVTIPTTQSRAKSVFTVMRQGNQAPAFAVDGSTDYRLDGQYQNLLNYRTQINGDYYPNQPIDLAQFIGGWHFSQEHLREMEKAFDSAGIPFRSVDSLKQNFVVSRALSSYGSSTNLTATPINLYLEYNSPADPVNAMDTITFVNHSVRVAITPMGIEVMS